MQGEPEGGELEESPDWEIFQEFLLLLVYLTTFTCVGLVLYICTSAWRRGWREHSLDMERGLLSVEIGVASQSVDVQLCRPPPSYHKLFFSSSPPSYSQISWPACVLWDSTCFCEINVFFMGDASECRLSKMLSPSCWKVVSSVVDISAHRAVDFNMTPNFSPGCIEHFVAVGKSW